jgi:2-polyprenyl-3-methyl-5-hydroxy-6-metoxy-1,4-benzoquinol methylase
LANSISSISFKENKQLVNDFLAGEAETHLNSALCRLAPLDARIPQWDFENLEKRYCPFCKIDNQPALLRPDSLSVACCDRCGCWYVDRHPTEKALFEFYEEYYETYRPADLSKKHAGIILTRANADYWRDWHTQTLSRVLNGLNGKRVVDVGCGLGQFLAMARSEGAEVEGCDLSQDACKFVREHLGITAHNLRLNECSKVIGAADAVVMRDLIEHPLEPLIEIETAYSMLKPGGCLLLHTPNAGEAGDNAETAKRWIGFRVDLEHLQYLSSKTIQTLATRYGMIIERLETSGFPYLKGIDKLPVRDSGSLVKTKVLHSIPGMRRIARTMRAVRDELSGKILDPRSGFYHLFAILRKAQGN